MLDKKISSIIQYKLPDYIRDDYPMYVAFVQAYVEFLEEEGNVLHYMERFKRNLDPDLADDDFLERYRLEFANTFPQVTQIPTNQLLKLMKEFYLAKGSEDSFRFIFTILYNTDIDIIYPREYMYVPSSGEYASDVVIYITGDNWFKLNFDNDDLAASIEGINSASTAVIDTITSTYINGQLVLKLELSSYDSDFEVGEQVILAVEDAEVSETVYGAVVGLTIDDGGTNYELDDEITITDSLNGTRAKAKITKLARGPLDQVIINNAGTGYAVGDLVKAEPVVGSNGYGFRARVYEVGGSGEIVRVRIEHGGYNYGKTALASIRSSGGSGASLTLNGDNIGKIERVQVTDGGIDYASAGTVTVSVASDNGVNADLTPVINTVFTEPKRYLDTRSTPSGISKIQDSYYYQQYSYVIASDVSPDKWLGQVKRIAHPAGTQLFGMYRLYGEMDLSIVLANADPTITYTVNLENAIDLGFAFTSAEYIELEKYNNDSCPLGLTYSDLEDMKFLDTFDWTVGDFADVTLNDVYTTGCATQTEKQESSVITIT